MIERIYLLLEIVAYLLIINNLYDKKFKFDFPAIFTIATEVIIFRLTNEGIISAQFRIIPYVLLVLYVYIEFKSSLKKLIINMLVTVLVIGGMQVLFGCVIFFVKNREVCALIVNFCVFITSFIISNLGGLKCIMQFINKYSREIIAVIASCGVLVIIAIITYRISGKLSFFEYVLIAFILLIVTFLTGLWIKEKNNIFSKDKEVNDYKKFNNDEKYLIQEMRHKQHEYKNQINALFGTCYVYASEKQLIEYQTKYMNWINNNNKYTDLLFRCNSKVLCGFIFKKFKEIEDINILLDYDICVCEIKDSNVEYSIIQILGILIDNAIEALNSKEDNKKIYVKIFFDNIKLDVEVRNIAEYMSQKMIKDIFKDGFSSKGRNRGIGLSNVKKIAKEINAEIVVTNIESDNINWIVFKIIKQENK